MKGDRLKHCEGSCPSIVAWVSLGWEKWEANRAQRGGQCVASHAVSTSLHPSPGRGDGTLLCLYKLT